MALLRDIILNRAQSFSNKDLSSRRQFTCSVGVATPAYVQEVFPSDSFHIKHSASLRTYPMLAPLMGSFRLQLSYFFVPTRLYTQTMDQNRLTFDPDTTYFPYFHIQPQGLASIGGGTTGRYLVRPTSNIGVVNGSLLDYMALGAGNGNFFSATNGEGATSVVWGGPFERFNATPIIGYFDILRNYFFNTQEDNFWMFVPYMNPPSSPVVNGTLYPSLRLTPFTVASLDDFLQYFVTNQGANFDQAWDATVKVADQNMGYSSVFSPVWCSAPSAHVGAVTGLLDKFGNWVIRSTFVFPFADPWYFSEENDEDVGYSGGSARWSSSSFRNSGLCLVTHRPDMFTAWLSQANYQRIVKSSTINVENNTITMNQIIMDSHLYDYYQRGLLAGGRYSDWVYAEYGVKNAKHLCIPQLLGVSSSYLTFSEVDNQTTQDGQSVTQDGLGGVGGKGVGFLNGYRQSFSSDEHGYLIALFTIVPNVAYWQGVDPLYCKTQFNDLYSPAMARIGYQTLPVYWLNAGLNYILDAASGNYAFTFNEVTPPFSSLRVGHVPDVNVAVGYQPAWQEYCTAINRVFSDMNPRGLLYYWSLARTFGLSDFDNYVQDIRFYSPYSSYVFPSQFTYAFANQSINAQNFIVDINFDVVARRQIGKVVTPTLA